MAKDIGWERERRLNAVRTSIVLLAAWMAANGEPFDWDDVMSEIGEDIEEALDEIVASR